MWRIFSEIVLCCCLVLAVVTYYLEIHNSALAGNRDVNIGFDQIELIRLSG